MLDFLSVGQKVRGLVILATGMPEEKVIFANQDGPRPKQTFCTVNIIAEQNLGQANENFVPTKKIATPQGIFRNFYATVERPVQFTNSLNFYGAEAKSLASSLQQANKRSIIGSYLLEQGLGWLQAKSVRDLTDIEFGRYFQRAQLDLDLMTMDTVTDEVFQTYTIEVGVSSPNSDSVLDMEINKDVL